MANGTLGFDLDRQQLMFRLFFYLLNYSKALSFHRCLQIYEEEKVNEGQFR